MLSVQEIKKAKATRSPYRLYDGQRSGLFCQVYPSGTKTWFVSYQAGDRTRFLNLGRCDPEGKAGLSLKEARDEANRVHKAYIDKGLDPQEEIAREKAELDRRRLAAERAAEREARLGSIDQLFKSYIARLSAEGKASATETKRIYEKDIEPVLTAGRKAKDVDPADIASLLRKIVERGALRYTDQVRGVLHAAFQFGLHQDYDPTNVAATLYDLKYNPVASVPRVQKKRIVGERHLSAVEVRTFWRMVTGSGMHMRTAAILKIVLATGQRLQEVVGMRWSEIDLELGIWELPPERTKNGRAHVVPLPGITISLLKRLERFRTSGTFVFPGRDESDVPVRWQSVSRALRRVVLEKEIEDFTPRDLRRTWKTLAGHAGISKDIRDRIQNHALHDVASKHYDRFDYLPQKTKAMSVWDVYLWSILRTKDPASTNVIQLRSIDAG